MHLHVLYCQVCGKEIKKGIGRFCTVCGRIYANLRKAKYARELDDAAIIELVKSNQSWLRLKGHVAVRCAGVVV
jgi:hypothetical protein